jgi:hypothetical protein
MIVESSIGLRGNPVELIRYKGHVWRRYPAARDQVNRSYFRREWWEGSKRYRESLHRRVWCDNYGSIRRGWDVHHRDGNPANNDLSNLSVVSRGEHARLHENNMRAAIEARQTHLHTPAGSEAHKAALLAYFTSRTQTVPCQLCGREFVAKVPHAKWCSPACGYQGRKAEKLL